MCSVINLVIRCQYWPFCLGDLGKAGNHQRGSWVLEALHLPRSTDLLVHSKLSKESFCTINLWTEALALQPIGSQVHQSCSGPTKLIINKSRYM